MPRAWIAYSWYSAGRLRDSLAAVEASTAQALLRRPVVEGAPAPPAADLEPSPAQLVEDGADRVAARAVAERDGYLVLNDVLYPGWQAEVDGRPVPIRAANASFRAVRVPAGDHEVVFTYRPASVTVGALISILALAGLGARAAAIALRKRRRGPGAPTGRVSSRRG